ncbi:fimbrial protein [Providencia alcalifaciens]|nr:fimbrial protein [Providencia alcalifaciens]
MILEEEVSIHDRSIYQHRWMLLAGVFSIMMMPLGHAGNTLELIAEIDNAGECAISVSPSLIEFKRRPSIGEFVANDAVDLQRLSLKYTCTGYETNARPEVNVTGSTATDTNLFLTADSTGAKGVGFMLKEGSVKDLSGYYNTGKTVVNGDSIFLPADINEGETPFTVGFIRQIGNNTVTAGAVKAAILFTVVMP